MPYFFARFFDLVFHKKTTEKNVAGFNSCSGVKILWSFNKWPKAYPIYLSLFYLITRSSFARLANVARVASLA